MAVTPSTMAELGSQAPDFSLPDTVGGGTVSRNDFAGKPLLVMFICNHCPFVIHVLDELVKIGAEYTTKGVGVVAICSNDVEKYPDDSPEKMAELGKEKNFAFPYLHDETQEVARSYDAACTPDFFLYDAEHRLAYRGQLDDSRPKSDEVVNGKDLRAALDAVLRGETPDSDQRASAGCNIKWRS